MGSMDTLDLLFVITALLFQAVLIVHFAFRRWRFETAIRYGYLVYALGLPAAAVSILLMAGGKAWGLWTGGLVYLAWGAFGYWSEYIRKIEWREPIRWAVFGPYMLLYLATCMFYWFPLALVWKPLWYAYAGLFVASTALNVASHRRTTGKYE